MQFNLTLSVKLKDRILKNLVLNIYLVTVLTLNTDTIKQLLSI
ncbi:hypothetical protein F909_02610 [Acinetobacter sp. ANC 3929]|nr:hypothetical protein F909_02610 [Acinetobacter sp. ANC 3929]